MWAGLAQGDGMALTPAVSAAGLGHGAQPVSAGFGALRFGTRGAGHGDHYGQSTESLANLARIAARPDAAPGTIGAGGSGP